MITVYEAAKSLKIKNKRMLSKAGRAVIEWYRRNNPDAISVTLSQEKVKGELKTFKVAAYPSEDAEHIKSIIKRVRYGNKRKNSNRRNKWRPAKKAI